MKRKSYDRAGVLEKVIESPRMRQKLDLWAEHWTLNLTRRWSDDGSQSTGVSVLGLNSPGRLAFLGASCRLTHRLSHSPLRAPSMLVLPLEQEPHWSRSPFYKKWAGRCLINAKKWRRHSSGELISFPLTWLLSESDGKCRLARGALRTSLLPRVWSAVGAL